VYGVSFCVVTFC